MIIVKIQGGLGNQLFQYANGRALSIEKNEDLYLDISWYKGRLDRAYLLNGFNIKEKIAGHIRVFLTKIFNKDKYIVGDFQSEKYFKKIGEKIIEEFTLKSDQKMRRLDILEKIKSTNSVSIHLRGGDYVRGKKSGFHGTASAKYYESAIQRIVNKVGNPYFFVFTDDIDWAKSHLKFPEPYIFVSNGEENTEEEFVLMTSCKHNIIANSTFSWWAAWLNRNKNKIIISPEKWFADSSVDSSEIIPQSWL